MGDKEKAMKYLLWVKGIFLERLGPEHPSTKNTQVWIDGLSKK